MATGKKTNSEKKAISDNYKKRAGAGKPTAAKKRNPVRALQNLTKTFDRTGVPF